MPPKSKQLKQATTTEGQNQVKLPPLGWLWGLPLFLSFNENNILFLERYVWNCQVNGHLVVKLCDFFLILSGWMYALFLNFKVDWGADDFIIFWRTLIFFQVSVLKPELLGGPLYVTVCTKRCGNRIDWVLSVEVDSLCFFLWKDSYFGWSTVSDTGSRSLFKVDVLVVSSAHRDGVSQTETLPLT